MTNMYSPIFILSFSLFTVSGQSITISGITTLVTPTSELKLTCQPSSAGVSDVNQISIQKNSSTSDYTTLVSVAYSKTSVSSEIFWTNLVLQNRQGVSATGNVDSVSGARLELTITQNNTRCEDGGAYRCNMGVILSGGGGGVADDEKYVTATVEPTYTKSMTVSPTPNVDGLYYSLGTILTFNCYGTVGSNKREHTWCYKRSTDATFTGYPDNAQNPSINQNNDGLTASGCNFIRSSSLTYNVTAADTSTTFMCEPYTGSFCGGSSANLKTELTIKKYVYVPISSTSSTAVTDNVGSTDVPEITTTPSRCVQCTCTGDVIPWIAVAVVFIIISIVLFIVVVYLCQQVGKYKERLRERVEYQGINTGFSKRDEHVYSTTDNYEIPRI